MRTAALNKAPETATTVVEDIATKTVAEIMEIIAAWPACNDGVLLMKRRLSVADEKAMIGGAGNEATGDGILPDE